MTPDQTLREAIRKTQAKRLAEGSLIEFTKQAWVIVEPTQGFKDNWHLHVIAEHLEAISKGEIKDLLINIPPSCMKSLLVSVMWPAWEWTGDPGLRYLGASYGEDLALRDSQKCRDIITSEWYQESWPEVKIKKGEDMKVKYALTLGGWRMASSVGGRATGEHPDRKIIDDPHSALQAQSDAERGRAIEWFDGTLSTRGASRNASTVVVMQRLHDKDISGHILEDVLGYTHLCLPMRYEKNSQAYKGDPRKEGELLWPEMFPESMVEKLEHRLGEYGSAGQFQQHPSPPGGGILKTKHFQMWKKEIPKFSFVVQSYDCAFTEKTSGDPSACTVWGIFNNSGKPAVMLLDAWAEHLGYPDLRTKVLKEWQSKYGGDETYAGRRADLILVEKKASGQSLLQDLRQSQVPARAYDPGTIDKINRAHIVAPILELDCIWIPESKKNPGRFTTWSRKFMVECEKFPNAEHDDMVDTFSQVLIYLRDSGMLEMDVSKNDDEMPEVDYRQKPLLRENPYSL